MTEELLNKALRVYPDTLSLLKEGWPTPLVRLRSECREGREVWAKLEFYNPFSRSVKDRPVWNMLRKAIEAGLKKPVVYEATSGNVGIALAALCNIFRLRLRAFLPRSPPPVTVKLLEILGAEVVETQYESITPEFWRWVAELAEREGALNLNQFENDANPEIHYETLARELVEQLEAVSRKPDYVLAGVGTSGHIYAIYKRLRERYGGSVKVVGVQPDPSSRIPGIKRIETGPKWLKQTELYMLFDISFEEAALGVIEVARREGLLVGLSSGAVYWAYKRLVEREGSGTYVLVFPDDIFKYVDSVHGVLHRASIFKAQP
jgi:cysteine synthase A